MKIIKITLNIFKYVLIGALAAALIFNFAGIFKKAVLGEQIPLVFGIGNAVIISGSMEPVIEIGDLIVIRKQDGYETGEIVTFRDAADNYITHRIVEKTAAGFITKGDANNSSDPEIKKSQIVGKVVRIAPMTGKTVVFLKSPAGLIIMILLLLAIFEMPRLFNRKEKLQ